MTKPFLVVAISIVILIAWLRIRDSSGPAQLARIARRDEKAISSLEEKFYKDADDREILLLRYIIGHRADFGAR